MPTGRLNVFYANVFVLKRAAEEHALKSFSPAKIKQRRQRQSIFTECGPERSVAARGSLLPHLLVTDIEVKAHIDGHICTCTHAQNTHRYTCPPVQWALVGAKAVL